MISGLNRFIRFNPSRKRLEDFLSAAAQSIPKNALVLDAGAGEGYYRAYFDQTKYQATDLCKVEKAYGRITYISNLENIPIQDKAYDVVICTQVLEHLPNPQKVMGELYRVLKPGGLIWLSTPLFFPEHEAPYDFYRYTQFGLTHLLTTSGFEIQQIDWLEGYFGSLAFQCRVAFRSLPISPSEYGPWWLGILGSLSALLLKPLFLLLSLFYGILETRSKYTKNGFCKNYTVIALRP